MSAILNTLLAAKNKLLYSGSLTAGSTGTTTIYYGLFSTAGSITPSTFTGAGTTLTVKYAFDSVSTVPTYASTIYIEGFTTDPGASFISSAQWGTGSLLTRVNYLWQAGTPNTGIWYFSLVATPNFGFQAGVGTTKTLSIYG